MARYRLPLLALIVAALVAVVALVAHGRPLSTSGGKGGLPQTFWDFALTTVILVVALGGIAMLAYLIAGAPSRQGWKPPPHTRSLLSVLGLGLIVSLSFVFRRYLHLGSLLHLFHAHDQSGNGTHGHGPIGGAHGHKHAAQKPAVRFRWDEVMVVLGLLLVAGMTFFAATRRRGTPRAWAGPAALAEALDESLDDLRSDPDVRRAIIAAYARMETALAVGGVPRRPAEAPLEYLERALLALDTSQAPVRRLTDLFQWARFSHHEPEPSMRDEAIDALVAVRDELRVPGAVAA